MTYQQKKISNEFINSVEKLGITKKRLSESLNIARQTLDIYLKEGEMPLSIFIKLCELLNLQPSTFFLENTGNINNAMHSPNTNQNMNVGNHENELLKQEIRHLKDKIELYERLIESYKK